MKRPEEYLDAAWQPDPEPWPAGGLPFVPQAQALRAITQALADAERYRQLLGQALRRQQWRTRPLPTVYTPETGTIDVGGQVLPFRVVASPISVSPTNGEEPPF